MPLSDSNLLIFKAISNFTTCLSDVFGNEHRSLKLYAHLINKTALINEKPILKHIDAFRVFCIANKDALVEKDINKIDENNKKIEYSIRVYIDIPFIFSKSDRETTQIIWKHLLTIYALVDPNGKARQVLKSRTGTGESNSEDDFLSNIIQKVEDNVDPNANPMEAVSSIMQSGIFTELVGGMGSGLEDGTLDLGKLMGSVQKMVTTLNDEHGGGENGEGDEAVNMINTMMGTIQAGANNKSQNGDNTPPDLTGMLNMMGPMLGAMQSNPQGNKVPPQLNLINNSTEQTDKTES
jgi:hypothetical protein